VRSPRLAQHLLARHDPVPAGRQGGGKGEVDALQPAPAGGRGRRQGDLGGIAFPQESGLRCRPDRGKAKCLWLTIELMPDEKNAHWQRTYTERSVEELSWTEPVPDVSLALIAEAGLPLDAAVLDVGGGASRLAAELLRRGYSDVTVADILAEALEREKADLGEGADRVRWIEADVRDHDFGRPVDLWHDRALFHFMVDSADRDDYLATPRRSLRPGGHLILATFGPKGPTECGGLPVDRYDAESLLPTLGSDFKLIFSRLAEHRTPTGRGQQFLYAHLHYLPDRTS
jgi:SAM-dependent methyltransferase